MVSPNRHVITIGGSSGSTAVLRKLLGGLPADLPASIFVSTHLSLQSPGLLADMLGYSTRIPVSAAVDGQPIEQGHIYVAVPDRHLLVIGETIRLGTGPQENMARPSIDALFRSAALSFGSRVIGVVLTGMLNDGASGLQAIKAQGGVAVVQHPLDAEADAMPIAALETVDVDHVATADGLAEVITALTRDAAGPSPPPTSSLRLEVDIAAGRRLGSDQLFRIANPSPLSCPDCHGVLSEIRAGQPLRYRCQIGHAYTADVLAARSDQLDEAIRIAMRIMEERVTLVERMTRDAQDSGRTAVAELYAARAVEYRSYAETLREAATTSLRMNPPEDL